MDRGRKKLYLIDGANYVFRAYYAIRNLSNSKGLPTGALYGFAQMLLKLVREEKPDLVAVCFDTAEPTFRDEMYAEYKANRKEPPDDLVQQFPYVRPLARALGIPILEKAGFEADDVIGTLAKRFASEGHEVVIVSGDKDLMQLVSADISILDEMKELRIGPKEVEEKFGVGPDKVVDVLGLSGDASDNIPGIDGVGPKTATTLIQKYGTVENVIAHADELKGALSEKVKRHADDARLSLRLATIDANVDIEAGEEDLAPRGIDEKLARKLFGELEFSKLLSELAPKKSGEMGNYGIVTNGEHLEKIASEIEAAGAFAIEVIASLSDPIRAEIDGFAFAWKEGKAVFAPVARKRAVQSGKTADMFAPEEGQASDGIPLDTILKIIAPLLKNPSIKKLGYNLNFALTILGRLGVRVNGVECDAELASYVLNPSARHDFESLSIEHLGCALPAGGEVSDIACARADAALRLSKILGEKVEKEGLSGLLREMEMPLLTVLVDMQMAGIKVDTGRLKVLEIEFSKKLSSLEGKIFAIAGESFNINSPKQLGEILFGKLKLPGAKRTKTGFSTREDILEELALSHDLPRLVLDYRSFAKLKGTYVDALPELINPRTKRIHTTFNQAVTATGRLSSSNPNLQNIPAKGEEARRIREAFVAEDGFVLLSADYSQIELRVLAHMSREKTLIDAFGKGLDVHAITASGIFGGPVENITKEQRAVGKTVNFATIYGQGAYGLSKQLGIDPGEAAEYIENYFRKYPGVLAYRDEVIEKAKKDGFVKTLFGRLRFVPDLAGGNTQMQSFAERAAFNTVFQGTAADIIKRAMITIHGGLSRVSAKSRMILQVHDELLFEAPEGEEERVKKFVVAEMQLAARLDVPLIVDAGIGKNWAEAH